MTKRAEMASCWILCAAAVGCGSSNDLGTVRAQELTPPPSPVVQFAPSPSGMCALHATGEVLCFQAGKPHTARLQAKFGRPMRLAGSGSQGPMCTVGWYGQLSCSSYSTNGRVSALKTLRWDKNFVDVQLGFFGGCVLIEEGSVACWGSVSPSADLRGGSLDFGPESLEAIRLPRKAVQIAVGEQHACAVLDDGRVFCHGSNAYGQVDTELKDGNDYDFTLPVAVPGITDAKQVAVTQNATCVLHASGKVTCFGAASETGLGPTSARSVYGQLELEAATAIASSRVSVCARVEGIYGADLYCWGSNQCGALGEPPPVCGLEGITHLDRPKFISGSNKTKTFALRDDLLCFHDGITSWCLGGNFDYEANGYAGHRGPYLVAL